MINYYHNEYKYVNIVVEGKNYKLRRKLARRPINVFSSFGSFVNDI